MPAKTSEAVLWRALVLRLVGCLTYRDIGARCGGVSFERARQMVQKAKRIWRLTANWSDDPGTEWRRAVGSVRARTGARHWAYVLRVARAQREARRAGLVFADDDAGADQP